MTSKNDSEKQVETSNPTSRLFGLRLLILVYAAFDLVRTFVKVQVSAREAFDEGVLLSWTPMYIHRWADSLLLLLATVGLWLTRPWGYLLSFVAGGWLLLRGFDKWRLVSDASFPEIPRWSWTSLRAWWVYHNGEWDLPRLVLGAIITVSGAILLLRRTGRKGTSEGKAA